MRLWGKVHKIKRKGNENFHRSETMSGVTRTCKKKERHTDK